MSELTTTGSYELVPLFQIRMAGAPFDLLSELSTPRSAEMASEINARLVALEVSAADALEALRRDRGGAGRRRHARLQRAIGMRLSIGPAEPAWPGPLARYAAERCELDDLCATYERELERELEMAAASLHESAQRYLPAYAVFSSDSFALPETGRGAPRWDRQRDRHLLLYLQRLAAKNETFSCFGPSGWGRIQSGVAGISFKVGEALRRHAYLERWVACAVVAAMNRDPEIRPEIPPRLHPAARLSEGEILRLDSGARVVVSPEALEGVRRCDGRTPAHRLDSPDALATLAQSGALVWEIECPAFVVDRLSVLRREVGGWRDGPARRRWERVLAELAAFPEAFERDPTPSGRRALVEAARTALESAGAVPPPSPGRVLYRAANPIGEECALEPELRVSREAADRLTQGASPWFDLWRDVYAFAAHRANERLRALHASVGQGSAAVPLPSFLAAAEAAGLSLQGNGVPALAYAAFRQAKAAFRDAVAGRTDAPEWALSAEDCSFLRRRFDFPSLGALAFPSADLQLAAASPQAVALNQYRWVIAELHLAATVLQHGIYWACPDREEFDSWVRHLAGGPMCDWGFVGADLATHTMIHYEALGPLWRPFRPHPLKDGDAVARPADAEVFIAGDGDVRIRTNGRDCGSFARSWVLPLGFHPFAFSLPNHTPRLTVGDVIVQREAWTIRSADFPHAPYRFLSPMLAVDVERLRSARSIPRFVYIRPTDAVAARLGAGGRDKDVKPVFLDLESYPFLDVLARWISKYGEVDVAEMLPAPHDLLWHEPDGRRTFELRTLLAPRGSRPEARLE